MSGAQRAISSCERTPSVASAGTCCIPPSRQENHTSNNYWQKSRGICGGFGQHPHGAGQIAPWVPGGLFTLGTDGFGRSDTRARLRRFFAVDVECTVIGTLYALAEKNLVPRALVAQAIKELGVDPEQMQPQIV